MAVFDNARTSLPEPKERLSPITAALVIGALSVLSWGFLVTIGIFALPLLRAILWGGAFLLQGLMP